MPLDPKIKAVLDKAGLPADATWHHKQSGQQIIKHWACERIGVVHGVTWDMPQIVSADPANKIAVICAVGHMGDATEWSFGEAAPYNTQQSYPFAMAEKRAKDRVILKLVGLHGLAYSEEEADTFREAPAKEPKPGDGVRGAAADDKPKNGVMMLGKKPPGAQDQKITECKANLKAFTDRLGSSDMQSIESLDDLVAEYEPTLQDAEKLLPTWMNGPLSEGMPINERIAAKRRFLESVANLGAA